jgi:hypothetical protein
MVQASKKQANIMHHRRAHAAGDEHYCAGVVVAGIPTSYIFIFQI